jgi:2-keto-4-pentenoate hydratase
VSFDPDALGERLYRAYVDADPVDPASLPAELTVAEGYAAQEAFLERRVRAEGEPVGYKVGFTSDVVRSDLGVDAPAFGRVLADTVREERRFSAEALIEPRVEPEVAVVLGDDLSPPASRLDVVDAVDLVVPVVEVVDSRIRGWEVTASTAVADNTLAARLLPGDRTTAGDVDLVREGVEVLVDGERRATGVGAAVLGHPADAVAWLAEALPEHGDALRAGDVVTTGSITEPVPLAAGETAVARFSSLGTVVAHAE